MSEQGERSWRGAVEDMRRAFTPRGRAGLGGFAIEGTRLHERALRAGAAFRRVIIARSYPGEGGERAAAVVAALRERPCTLHVVPDPVMHELTEGRSNGAILGLVRFPEPPSLRQLIARAGPAALLLVAVEVEDPGNVGALVRSALAAGADGFVAVGISDPFHPRAVRTSMGSLFKLPVVHYPSAGALLADLEGTGTRKVAAISREGTPLPRVAFGEAPTAVFVGSEAFGLQETVASALDVTVSIPMADGVDSYSVNAAAAIVLYEIRRQAGAALDGPRESS